MIDQKKLRTPSELNIPLGGVIEVGIQASHQKMLNTIINPFWNNFEIILTPAKINKPETHLKLKKTLPNGVVIKKIDEIPNGVVGTYSDVLFTRLTGQSISIYPSKEANPEEFTKPFYVMPVKPCTEYERRRSNSVRMRIVIPTCWNIHSFENSQAQEDKVAGKDLANAIFKLYQAQNAGIDITEKLEETYFDFLKAFGLDGHENVDETMLMPQHRANFINLKLLQKITRQENNDEISQRT